MPEHDDVIEECAKAIEHNPEDAEAYFYRGNAYVQKGDNDSAINDLSKAIDISPHDSRAYYSRGVAYREKGDNDSAINDFNKAINISPQDSTAYYSRGNTYYIKGDYDSAIADYTKAIEIKPNYSATYNNRGNAYNKKGDNDSAINDFNKAINISPDDSTAYYNRGIAYSDKGDNDSAINDFNKAINISPDDSTAYYNRGNACYKKGDYDNAIVDFTKAIEISPNDPKAYGNRGIAYGEKGNHDRAISDFSKVIEISSNDSKAYYNRGNAYGKKGDYDTAIADYTKAIEINPDCLTAYIRRGFAYGMKGNYNKAIDDFTKTINNIPDYSTAYFLRGTIYKKQDDNNRAITDFAQAMSNYKQNDIEMWHFLEKYLGDILGSGKNTILWKTAIQTLKCFPHFFIKMIIKFREKRFASSAYQRLIQSVYILWNSLRCGEINTKIYQYTSQATLNEMKKTRSLRLIPACYQNDPEEGVVFYKYLLQMLKKEDQQIVEIIDKIKKEIDSNSIAFIRSFSTNEDNLIMWDSSYAKNGEGVSIGISSKKLNKGYGIDEFREKNIIEDFKSEPEKQNTAAYKETSEVKESSKFLKIEKTGLYKILYLDKDKEELRKIKNALLAIKKDLVNEERKKELIPLLSELFTSITHLIKDSAYEHEHEYRLMHIGSIEDDKDFIESSIDTGIYIDTEPIVFTDPKDKETVYFGPKVDNITVLRAKHIFEHAGLAAEIKKSGIQYR